jgi:hypothetical protein
MAVVPTVIATGFCQEGEGVMSELGDDDGWSRARHAKRCRGLWAQLYLKSKPEEKFPVKSEP